MRVPVKLLGFNFWLFFLNCGQCQVCHREDIKYENTEIIAKDLYAHGETVKVYCMTGFTGTYKLKCDRGQWKALIRRPCAKKKCSHPGNSTHGEFKLTEGTEYVFGATVVYTCNKGYEMTTRINRRTCRSQGWDNTVPVCEVVTCPAIQTSEDVTASGNTEEGSYGDVIHFECVSSDKKIKGSTDIHCKDTGEWSDAVPTCKEIRCEVPHDQYVSGIYYYFSGDKNLGAKKSYYCESGYRKTADVATCTRDGWTPKPLCAAIMCADPNIPNAEIVGDKRQNYKINSRIEYKCNPGFEPEEHVRITCDPQGRWRGIQQCTEVSCELKSSKFEVKNISPMGKTIFRAGEKVEITCSETHWFSSKDIIKEFTCLDSGEWNFEPVCEEIRCEVPHDQYVSGIYYYFRGDKSLGAKKYYSCESGYHKTADVATCTRDGWTPKPLCAEIMCADPKIPNAEIVGDKRPNYKINSRIEYKCNPGFEPEEHVRITCDPQGRWRYKQCKREPVS